MKKKICEYIAGLIAASDKSQIQIAEECGFPKPNMITMIKQGASKVPYDKIPALAKSLRTDGGKLMRMAYLEYEPKKLKAIEECLGLILSDSEKDLISQLRNNVRADDISFSAGKNKEALNAFIETLNGQ